MAVCRHAEYFSGCLESLDGFVFHPRSRYWLPRRGTVCWSYAGSDRKFVFFISEKNN